MSRKNRLLVLILSAVLVAATFAGCTPAATTTAPATTPAATTIAQTTIAQTTAPTTTAPTTLAPTSPPTTTTAKPAAFPVTVKNGLGQDVTVKAQPQAIIVTNIWAAEMVLDMVPASRIKGLSAWGDDPLLSPTADKAKQVKERVQTTKAEGIVALKPDLVIIDTFSDYDGSLSKTLTEAGITVLLMQSPTDFDQIRQALQTIALVTGETAKGAELIAAMDKTLNDVKKKLASVSADKKIKTMYYEDHLTPDGKSDGMLAAYGPGSPFHAIAEAASMINVCTATNYAPVSKEKVVKEWKPEVLVVPGIIYDANFSTQDDKGKAITAAIKADPLLQTLPAVQESKIVALADEYRGSTSHYMALAVRELAAYAYPDLMK